MEKLFQIKTRKQFAGLNYLCKLVIGL
jgi:hypothetical protein